MLIISRLKKELSHSFAMKVLKRFGMKDAKPVGSPLANHFRLYVK